MVGFSSTACTWAIRLVLQEHWQCVRQCTFASNSSPVCRLYRHVPLGHALTCAAGARCALRWHTAPADTAPKTGHGPCHAVLSLAGCPRGRRLSLEHHRVLAARHKCQGEMTGRKIWNCNARMQGIRARSKPIQALFCKEQAQATIPALVRRARALSVETETFRTYRALLEGPIPMLTPCSMARLPHGAFCTSVERPWGPCCVPERFQ
jgi:hypothetical protein